MRAGCIAPLFSLQRKFVFQDPQGAADEWFLPLQSFINGGLIVWPCVKKQYGDFVAFELDLTIKEPVVLARLWPVEKYIAWPIAWRSHFWQVQNLGPLAGQHKQLRMFGTKVGKMELFRLACHSAFWSLSRTFIVEMAHRRSIDIDKGSSLFEVLFQILSVVFAPMDEDEMLNIISVRLHASAVRLSHAPGLLAIDEAIEVLDRDDHEKLKDEKTATKACIAEKADFAAHFKEKRQAVRERKALQAATAATSSRNAARARKSAPKAVASPPRRWTSQTTHAEAKTMLPPGSSIWRGLTKRCWCGHAPPARRVSAPWDGPLVRPRLCAR